MADGKTQPAQEEQDEHWDFGSTDDFIAAIAESLAGNPAHLANVMADEGFAAAVRTATLELGGSDPTQADILASALKAYKENRPPASA